MNLKSLILRNNFETKVNKIISGIEYYYFIPRSNTQERIGIIDGILPLAVSGVAAFEMDSNLIFVSKSYDSNKSNTHFMHGMHRLACYEYELFERLKNLKSVVIFSSRDYCRRTEHFTNLYNYINMEGVRFTPLKTSRHFLYYTSNLKLLGSRTKNAIGIDINSSAAYSDIDVVLGLFDEVTKNCLSLRDTIRNKLREDQHKIKLYISGKIAMECYELLKKSEGVHSSIFGYILHKLGECPIDFLYNLKGFHEFSNILEFLDFSGENSQYLRSLSIFTEENGIRRQLTNMVASNFEYWLSEATKKYP